MVEAEAGVLRENVLGDSRLRAKSERRGRYFLVATELAVIAGEGERRLVR